MEKLTDRSSYPYAAKMPASPAKSAERRLTARGKERRDHLLAYAIERFAENGYHPTSVADIVEGVGVGKGVFYWYFPSKEALLLEILGDALLDLRRTQQAAIRDLDDPLALLERGIRASISWAASHAEIMRLVMFSWTEETFSESMKKGRRINIADTARHVQSAIDLELIPPGDPILLATAIRGVTDEIGRQLAIDGEAATDEVLDAAVRLCLYGLIGPR